tara:strand:- start:833 stop:2197 length:1365 start_codon:yes stop_codon:yes gene_type:complete
MNIVILAAGKGSRMKSSLTKVLHQIGGKSMISHVVQTAISLKPKKIFIVVSENKKDIEAELAPFSKPDLKIVFVDQNPALGTGHAVMLVAPKLDTSYDTLILYGDVPLVSSGSLKILSKKPNRAVLRILTAVIGNPKGYGRIIRDDNELIKNCIEEKDATTHEKNINEINTGIMFATTKELIGWLTKIDNNNAQNEYYLTQIISFANADKVSVFPVSALDAEEVSGVNSQVQKSAVERIFQKKCAIEFSEKGLEINDINRFDLRGELTFDDNVKIDVGCLFIGKVTIGKGVLIEPYCIIKNSSIGSNTTIKAFTHIENSVIGSESTIGPYSRLRPNTQVDKNCKIGNFVETKNIKLSENSKVNHLSYIGDAQVGRNVNIGAGTITCNYDGQEKHQTTIEDDSFIGSNSELIAPVTVKKGATIGAGTTLSEDAPEKSLTISRTKQVSIASWKKSK